MKNHTIVSKDEWLKSRVELLQKEKEFTRLRDELSQQRRRLPWVKVNKDYIFQSANGDETLSDLFGDRGQLIVYHFMFHPDWEEGCKSCSFWADNYNGITAHLEHRDVTLLAVSRASLEKLDAFKKRMGWNFKWVSSQHNDFNRDFHVSFTPEELEAGDTYYNYEKRTFPAPEAPGISVFYKSEKGEIFHTYSCYARGLDIFNGAYHYLDIVPKGRDEANLSYSMEWLKLKDDY